LTHNLTSKSKFNRNLDYNSFQICNEYNKVLQFINHPLNTINHNFKRPKLTMILSVQAHAT